jgi:DNA polymerase alpha subunit B
MEYYINCLRLNLTIFNFCRLNEVLFAICSNDLLYSLSLEEVSNVTEGSRMERLAAHILNQHTFCPQFPVPSSIPAQVHNVFTQNFILFYSQYNLKQIDFRQFSHIEFKVRPDVLIVPSRLTQFAKDVEGSLVINPGTLAKNVSGGTFATVSVHPLSVSELTDAVSCGMEKLGHNISLRTSVQIEKI